MSMYTVNDLQEFGNDNLYVIYDDKTNENFLVKKYDYTRKSYDEIKKDIKIYDELISSLDKLEQKYFLEFDNKISINTNDNYYTFFKLDSKDNVLLSELNISGLSRSYTLDEKYILIYNIMHCIKILHENDIPHCYLSDKNFIITDKTNVKILDFNYACAIPNNYMSPESIDYELGLMRNQFDLQKSDIFILGIIILQIIWSQHPFFFIDTDDLDNVKEFYEKHLGNFVIDPLFKEEKLSFLGDIIKNMLELDPNNRNDIDTLIQLFESKIYNKTLIGGNPNFGIDKNDKIFQEYDIEKYYGSGATSRVFRVHKRDDPSQKYVIKYIPFEPKQNISVIINEVNVLKKIKKTGCKPDILCYEKTIKNTNGAYIITKLFREETVNLIEYLNKISKFVQIRGMKNKLQIIKNLLNAVNEIHNIKIVHGDIKPENFLIDDKTLEIQLIDFGFARDMESTDVAYPYAGLSGTIGFMAPELIMQTVDKSKLYKCDIFSLGIVLYEIINGNYPAIFSNDKINTQFFYSHYEMMSKSNFPEIDEIINKMLKFKVDERSDDINQLLNSINSLMMKENLDSMLVDIENIMDTYESIHSIYKNLPEIEDVFVDFPTYYTHLEQIYESDQMQIRNFQQFPILQEKIDSILNSYERQLQKIDNDLTKHIGNLNIYIQHAEKIKQLHEDFLYKLNELIL